MWIWETDKEAIDEAQKDLDDFLNDQEIADLEEKRDEALATIDDQIEAWEKYKDSWDEVVDDYETQQAKLILAQKLGADAESQILQQRLEVLEKFKD